MRRFINFKSNSLALRLMEDIMRPAGWKKDPVWRAYHEAQMRERQRRLMQNAEIRMRLLMYEEQMRAVDEAAREIVSHEAAKVPRDATKH